MELIDAIRPELVLVIAASVLFLIGVINKAAARMLSAAVALLALLFFFLIAGPIVLEDQSPPLLADPFGSFYVLAFAQFVKTLAGGVGILFVLMSWPTNDQGTGNGSLDVGTEAGEFF